jgi:hypothetical protein
MVPPAWDMVCGDSVFLYSFGAANPGKIFGNNSYGETECAQRYNFVTGSISEVLVWYGFTKGTNGTTTAKIYSIDGTAKGPLTALGTSAVVTTGNITTNPFTSYMFTPAVSVAGGFCAGIVFPTTTGDSVGILSFKFGCSSPDSLSWIKIGGWLSVTGSFNPPNNNTDLMILPIGTVNSGVNEYSAAGLSLLGAYPNPAKDETTISFNIKNNSKVSVKIFDVTGNTVMESTEERTSGNQEFKMNVKTLASGTYYYTVTTNTSSLSSKFSVIK